MIAKRINLTILLIGLFISPGTSQSVSPVEFDKSFYSTKYNQDFASKNDLYMSRAKAVDSYYFMQISYLIDGLTSMWLSTGNEKYLSSAYDLTVSILSDSKVSQSIASSAFQNKDSYRAWISNKGVKSTTEVVLYEGYLFEAVSRMLYEIQERGVDITSFERVSPKEVLDFVETHVWQKWSNRSAKSEGNKYTLFMRRRVHMASHWATIALYLRQLTGKKEYGQFVDSFDKALRDNLRKVSNNGSSLYIWNSSWDRPVLFADVPASKITIIQDVSHANSVVNYIYTAVKLGSGVWAEQDIELLINTLKENVISKGRPGQFNDNVDGSALTQRQGSGAFQSAGWVKLSEFDAPLREYYESFYENQLRRADSRYQKDQFLANLLYAKLLSTNK